MMGYVFSTCKILATTFANIFRKPVTVQFPDEIAPRAPRQRSSFALLYDDNNEELCIGCLACERICPSEVITVVGGAKFVSEFSGKKRGSCDDFMLDLQACIICELCVQVCPTDAIVMVKTQEEPSYSREGLLLTKERLHANAKRAQAWSTGSILMEMQNPKKGKAKPVNKAAKPAPKAEAKPVQAKVTQATPKAADAKPQADAKPKADESQPVEVKEGAG